MEDERSLFDKGNVTFEQDVNIQKNEITRIGDGFPAST